MEPGYLLNNGRAIYPPRSAPATPPSRPPKTPLPYSPQELEEKARKRLRWPEVRTLTGTEMGLLAKLRGCPSAAVEIMAQNGLLVADDSRLDCYTLADGTFRQFRRLDGQMMPCGKKSQNAPGSLAKGFFGLRSQFANLEPDDLIFIVEGAVGLLEGVSMQWLCAPYARRWKILASHSASSRFFYEPVLLKAISGKHVRIFGDPGKAGTEAAQAWRDEVRAVGCTVDAVKMPAGFEDPKILLQAGTYGMEAVKSIMAYPKRKGGAP